MSAREETRLVNTLARAISLKDTAFVEYMVRNHNTAVHEALKGIFHRGCSEESLGSKHDEIMELAAALLVVYYKDNAILPEVVDLIFRHNRKGLLVHNLVWVFFEARNPGSLLLPANYLLSSDIKDYEFGCRLLGFIPCVEKNRSANSSKMHYEVCQWIQENSPFLYRTDECLHLTAFPIPYALSLEAKYLSRPVSPNDGTPFRNYSDDEEILLNSFRALDPATRLSLAGFSYFLYRRNMYQWKDWINYPIEEQLRTMKLAMGGRQ